MINFNRQKVPPMPHEHPQSKTRIGLAPFALCMMFSISGLGRIVFGRTGPVAEYVDEYRKLLLVFALLGWIFVSLSRGLWAESASARSWFVGWLLLSPILLSGVILPSCGIGFESGNALMCTVPGLLVSGLAVTLSRASFAGKP